MNAKIVELVGILKSKTLLTVNTNEKKNKTWRSVAMVPGGPRQPAGLVYKRLYRVF
jgi:hypothetical protein